MSRVSGSDIVSEIRLDKGRLAQDANNVRKVFKDLARDIAGYGGGGSGFTAPAAQVQKVFQAAQQKAQKRLSSASLAASGVGVRSPSAAAAVAAQIGMSPAATKQLVSQVGGGPVAQINAGFAVAQTGVASLKKSTNELQHTFHDIEQTGVRSFERIGSGAAKTAKKTEGAYAKLTRQFASSSGVDPFVNAIARFGPAAAGTLATLKLLEVGIESFNTRASIAAANARGDIDAAVKAEAKWNEMLSNLPIVGGLGAAIRERFTHEQEKMDAQAFDIKQQEKGIAFQEKRTAAQKASTKAAKDLLRTTEREIAMLNKSPRQREIMDAQHALEDYKRELKELQKQTGLPFSQRQNAAVEALERKIQAVRNKRGPAEFSDSVSAAQKTQIAILQYEEDGAKKQIQVARKAVAEKKKIREAEAVDPRVAAGTRAKDLTEKIRQLSWAASQGDPVAARAVKKATEERRIQRKIALYGTVTEAETVSMNQRQGRALAQRQLFERMDVKYSNGDMKALLAQQQLERERLEKSQSYRRRIREGGRLVEEERLNRPLDSLRSSVRKAMQQLLGVTPGSENVMNAPREGDKEYAGSAKKLADAAGKLDDAAKKIWESQVVGVIKR